MDLVHCNHRQNQKVIENATPLRTFYIDENTCKSHIVSVKTSNKNSQSLLDISYYCPEMATGVTRFSYLTKLQNIALVHAIPWSFPLRSKQAISTLVGKLS